MFDPDTTPFYPAFLQELEAANQSLAVELSASPVHDEALLGPPERLEALPKRNDAGQHFVIVLDVWMKERDATPAGRLLRARRQ
jgi:hypothetical protein